ncbi:MAG: FecR domain-containing protein [Pseudomonadota bacterium]
MTHQQYFIRAVWAGIFLTLSAVAMAQTAAIGYVKTVSGEASVTTAGQRIKAAPGTPIQIGSQLKTHANASMGITFKDNTMMAFGPDTELTVDEYLYAPAQGQLRLGTNLVKGSLNYVSGVIAKLKPEAVTVKTPTGIIGVRGTQFVAKVEDVQ